MEITEENRILIAQLVQTLANDLEYNHSMATIKRIAGAEAARMIVEQRADLIQANKDAANNGGAALSAEAADYWEEAQKVLAYGRLALSGNDRKHKKNRALSQKCEKLAESFEARVPQNEKGKFITYDVCDPNTVWDDRWHWTADHTFPILHPQFLHQSGRISNTKGEAQRIVLSSLLDANKPPKPPSNADYLQQLVARNRRD
jgi:predicted component of type VI protein secretion system